MYVLGLQRVHGPMYFEISGIDHYDNEHEPELYCTVLTQGYGVWFVARIQGQ